MLGSESQQIVGKWKSQNLQYWESECQQIYRRVTCLEVEVVDSSIEAPLSSKSDFSKQTLFHVKHLEESKDPQQEEL